MKQLFKMTPIDRVTMVELNKTEKEIVVALLEDELEKTERMMVKYKNGFISGTWKAQYLVIKPLLESLR